MQKILLVCCAPALASPRANVRTIAKIPTHFRFSMVRRGSPQVLDFILSEQESRSLADIFLFISLLLNRKPGPSFCRRVQNHLMTRSARANTFGGIIRVDLRWFDMARYKFEFWIACLPNYLIRSGEHGRRDC